MLPNPPLETLGVGHKEVISYQLHPVAQSLPQLSPSFPVIFGQTVFDGDDGVVIQPLLVEVNHFAGGEGAAFSCQHILAIVIELARGRIHPQEYIHARFVTRCLDCCDNDL